MNKSEIEAKVIEIIALQFGITIDEIDSDTNFQSDLNADSLDAVEIIMSTEDRFDIKIPDEESYNLVTIKLLVEYVQRRLHDNSS